MQKSKLSMHECYIQSQKRFSIDMHSIVLHILTSSVCNKIDDDRKLGKSFTHKKNNIFYSLNPEALRQAALQLDNFEFTHTICRRPSKKSLNHSNKLTLTPILLCFYSIWLKINLSKALLKSPRASSISKFWYLKAYQISRSISKLVRQE